jgi:DNA-binding SARP family transcriptional activator
VFEHTPRGVLVTEAGGVIVATNPAAESMLGDVKRLGGDERPRCCDLFGCGRAGGPLPDACVTDLALSGIAVADVRIDLPGGPTPVVWLTAAAGESGRAILELRPGRARDRRRRADTGRIPEGAVRLSVLGPTMAETAAGAVGGPWLRQRPGQLLNYLVSRRWQVTPSEVISEALWPGAEPDTVGRVRQAVHLLRRRLDGSAAESAESAVASGLGGYGLTPGHVSVDADDFAELVDFGMRALGSGAREVAADRLSRALALYRGNFLADEPFADWAFAEREHLLGLAGRALEALTGIAVEDGDLEQACRHLERQIVLQPFDTDLHRRLIELCLRRGRRSEAVRRYDALRASLRQRFNEDVDFLLMDLVAAR